VAGRAHVGVDTTVSTVSTTALLHGLVNLDMRDDKVIGVQALDLSIALSVFKELENELARLNGPPALATRVSLILGLVSAASGALVAEEGNAALVGHDVLKVLLGALELHLPETEGGLPSVLKVNAKVRTASLAALGGIGRLPRVLHHFSPTNFEG